MTENELRAARDDVWEQLGSTPVRRALLGRERCDAITRVAADNLAELSVDLAAAAGRAGHEAAIRERLERRVRRNYHERAGFAFMSLVIAWAISAIVQALVIRWLNSRGVQR